ncbi:TOMM precursor leader peptide-binding protein [Nonomuraea diastatica]|uniref:TOMM precursor leader peptide-binding protein n=1 Tax=Nonomuraea diastatica TaxID=1848329 RepID=UPI00140C8BB4|nr:TOMM precursor leader peptide-binding protein [Nonomuraea diastatica]
MTEDKPAPGADALVVGVVGEGLLAEAIASSPAIAGVALPAMTSDTGELDERCSAVVLASDGWDTRAYANVRRIAAEGALPWLPVRAELGRVLIGPAEVNGSAGCVDCAELRRRLARKRPQDHDTLWERHGSTMAERPSSWLTALAAELIAELTADEMKRLVTGTTPPLTRQAMVEVHLQDLATTIHSFLPDPRCLVCGALPDDAPSLARITLEPRVKADPAAYRVRAVAEELDHLESTFVDAECGLIRSMEKGSDGGVVLAGAEIGLRGGGSETGWGRTRGYRSSKLVAMLEALERYGGMEPGGKRTTVRAAYSEVRDNALDPRTLGLHSAEAYALADFPYRPFDETRPYRWVWGYSFARQAPILVPEQCAYYRLRAGGRDDAPFVYEVSNGCALGGCLEEAILYGMLEVAERDAFLMTWYARMAVPRIELSSAVDRTIPLIVKAIEADTGYGVLAFDTTLEQAIPCVWVMAVAPSQDQDRPKIVCAAGSHLDPERAAERALSELGPILSGLIRRYPAQRERALEMAADPRAVKIMPDHSLLYGSPEVFSRLRFLTESTRTHDFTDLPRTASRPHTDLRDDLAEVLRSYLDSGLDVIVVDQTTPEHRAGGFANVKVIIPGTLPMTFGHDYRRLADLPRLFDVPHRLGHHRTRLTAEDINPHPHPFP